MRSPWPVLLMARELGLGGSERQLCELAKSLDRSRFEPHVACFHAAGFRAEELRAAGVPILELPVRSLRSVSALAAACRMGRYAREHRIQLLHTFDYPSNSFGVPAARAFQVPVVISSQRSHRRLRSRPFRHVLRLTDLLVDGIVVNCDAVRRHLIEDEHVPPALIHLCHNGLDTARFQPGPRCRPPELAAASLVVGVIGAFRPEKDLGTLLDAFARIRPAQPGLHLLLVGAGPALEELRERARRLALGANCLIQPATKDVARWLRAIDIFVLPSRSEALSNSLMEAMASGCCAVASRVGGNPELVRHEVTGLLFRTGDVDDLAGCLMRLLGSADLRQSLASAGAARIRENFSLHASARRMEEIYTELIGRKLRARGGRAT